MCVFSWEISWIGCMLVGQWHEGIIKHKDLCSAPTYLLDFDFELPCTQFGVVVWLKDMTGPILIYLFLFQDSIFATFFFPYSVHFCNFIFLFKDTIQIKCIPTCATVTCNFNDFVLWGRVTCNLKYTMPITNRSDMKSK